MTGSSHPSADAARINQMGRSRRTSDASPALTRVLRQLTNAVEEGRFFDATSIVRAHWFDVMRMDDPSLLIRALEGVSPEMLRTYPLLAMALALSYNSVPNRRLRSVRLFIGATQAAGSSKHMLSTIDRAFILSAASAAYRLLHRLGQAADVASKALTLLDALEEDERQAVNTVPRLYAQLGISLFYGGRTEQALDAFERGLAETRPREHRESFSNIAMLAGIHALNGELKESAQHLLVADSPSFADADKSRYTATFYRIARATMAIERFDAPAARDQLDSLQYDRRTIEHWVYLATAYAQIELVQRRPGAAASALEEYVTLRRAEGRSASARQRLATMRSLLQLALGSPDAAHIILERDGARDLHTVIARARAELTLGRHGSALQLIRGTAGARLPARARAEAAAIEAAALLRFSDRPRTRAVVDELGALLERTGQRFAVTLLPQKDFCAVRAALEDSGYEGISADLPGRSLIPDTAPESPLTSREVAVLRALQHSASAVAIAKELVVSVNTVKSQLRSVYRKLGASSRDEALAIALDRHLLTGSHIDTE